MGYTTDFIGEWTVTPPLKPEHRAYLKAFNETRRMKRDASETAKRPDPVREAAGLDVGVEGAYFVGEEGFMGQGSDKSIDVVEINSPPSNQPGLWCQWTPSEDGTQIEWDGGESFYDYVEWITYLIEHFLEPWGYKLNGDVRWQGEDPADIGMITIADNDVRELTGRITYGG